MVVNNSYPNKSFPCLVQINYYNGDIGFYMVNYYEYEYGLPYGRFVALFKCKLKHK
jgi:hypothetical protein